MALLRWCDRISPDLQLFAQGLIRDRQLQRLTQPHQIGSFRKLRRRFKRLR